MLAIAVGALFSLSATAANWPHWRGPNFDGSSPEKNLPVKWSKTENIAWTLALPGPAASTPVIWDNHIFISTSDKGTRSLWAMCAHKKTGAVMWKQKVADAFGKDDKSNFASPSPVTDGKRVIFFYGNGELVAYDFGGNKLWGRNIQKDEGDFAFLWTFSTSPLLYDGKLYMQVLQRDVQVQGRGKQPSGIESYLLAIDPATGKTLWRQVRPSEAKEESRESFNSPVPFEHNGRKEILVAGGDCLTGHDPATGKEFWRWGTWNPQRIGHWRLVPSPVAGAGIVLACTPKGGPVFAIAAGANGNLSDGDFAWKSDPQRGITTDVPTPLFYDGDFFVWSDVKKSISRVDPKTGQAKWTAETPGRSKYEASPAGADGKIYGMNFKGEVVVVDAAKGEVLNTIAMGEEGDDMTRSSIVIAGGQLFIRTNTKLFCVGKTQTANSAAVSR